MIVTNQNEIRNLIFKHNKWEIFIHPEDEYSKAAVELLEKHGQKNVIIHDIVKENRFQNLLLSGFYSTPIIYKDDRLFGGYPELRDLFSRRIFTEQDLGRM